MKDLNTFSTTGCLSQFPVQFPWCTSWAEPQTPSLSHGLSQTGPMETSWSTSLDIMTRYTQCIVTHAHPKHAVHLRKLTLCPSASLRVQTWTVQRVCSVRPTQWPSALWFLAPSTPSRSELEMNEATAPTATPYTSPLCLWVQRSFTVIPQNSTESASLCLN